MKHKSIIEARNFFIIVMIIGINLILRCFIMKSAIVKNDMDLIFTMHYLKVFLIGETFKGIHTHKKKTSFLDNNEIENLG